MTDTAVAECKVDGCGLEPHGRGYCPRHLKQWQRTGDPIPTRTPAGTSCRVEGCGFFSSSKTGLCGRHKDRFDRYGEPGPPFVERPCRIEGCERPMESREMCKSHYTAWRDYTPVAVLRAAGIDAHECDRYGCTRAQLAKGLCRRCYNAVAQGGARLDRKAKPVYAKGVPLSDGVHPTEQEHRP